MAETSLISAEYLVRIASCPPWYSNTDGKSLSVNLFPCKSRRQCEQLSVCRLCCQRWQYASEIQRNHEASRFYQGLWRPGLPTSNLSSSCISPRAQLTNKQTSHATFYFPRKCYCISSLVHIELPNYTSVQVYLLTLLLYLFSDHKSFPTVIII